MPIPSPGRPPAAHEVDWELREARVLSQRPQASDGRCPVLRRRRPERGHDIEDTMEVLPAASPVLAMTSGRGRNVCCSSRIPTITRSAVSTVPPTKTRPATRGRVPDRAMTSAGEHSACCSSRAPAPCYHSAGRVRSPADDAAKSSTKLPAASAVLPTMPRKAARSCLPDVQVSTLSRSSATSRSVTASMMTPTTILGTLHVRLEDQSVHSRNSLLFMRSFSNRQSSVLNLCRRSPRSAAPS